MPWCPGKQRFLRLTKLGSECIVTTWKGFPMGGTSQSSPGSPQCPLGRQLIFHFSCFSPCLAPAPPSQECEGSTASSLSRKPPSSSDKLTRDVPSLGGYCQTVRKTQRQSLASLCIVTPSQRLFYLLLRNLASLGITFPPLDSGAPSVKGTVRTNTVHAHLLWSSQSEYEDPRV